MRPGGLWLPQCHGKTRGGAPHPTIGEGCARRARTNMRSRREGRTMSMWASSNVLQRLLDEADVRVNGTRPWDIQVHNEALYSRVLARGSLGLGEAYMDRWWDCGQLDQFFCRVLSAHQDSQLRTWPATLRTIAARLTNLQRPARAFHVGRQHYDIGNDLYQRMLDRRLIYSCGYWNDASTLEEAQEAKLDLVCQKLDFRPGQHVLDIGCGWGGAARFAAERYGVSVVGTTVSEEQAVFATKHCAGLPVKIQLQDYRATKGSFDRIFSIGMFEHVGYKNYDAFMNVVRRTLKKRGRFLLHTIGNNRPAVQCDPWFETYIFPNSMLPSASQIARAFDGQFVLEDWQNFGADYDRTLMAWHQNFIEAWPELQHRYGDRFGRMWTYYLLSCAGMFRARKAQTWQVLLSDGGIPGGFDRAARAGRGAQARHPVRTHAATAR